MSKCNDCKHVIIKVIKNFCKNTCTQINDKTAHQCRHYNKKEVMK